MPTLPKQNIVELAVEEDNFTGEIWARVVQVIRLRFSSSCFPRNIRRRESTWQRILRLSSPVPPLSDRLLWSASSFLSTFRSPFYRQPYPEMLESWDPGDQHVSLGVGIKGLASVFVSRMCSRSWFWSRRSGLVQRHWSDQVIRRNNNYRRPRAPRMRRLVFDRWCGDSGKMAAAAAAPRLHRRSRIHPTNGSSSVLLMSAATYVDWVGAATQQPSRGTEPDQFRRDIVVPSVRLYVGMSWVWKTSPRKRRRFLPKSLFTAHELNVTCNNSTQLHVHSVHWSHASASRLDWLQWN